MAKEYGVTPTGFVGRGYAEIDEELRVSATNSFRAVLGQSSQWDLTWDSSSPVCVFYRVLESELYRLWQTAEEIYYSASPLTASGDALDLLVGEHGITRRPATKARGIVTVRGDPGTVLEAGTPFVTADGLRFLSTERVTIPPEGKCDVWVEAEDYGARYNLAAGSITLIENGSFAGTVDSSYHAVTLGVTVPANISWNLPADGKANTYQVVRASDIEHPHLINEVCFWFRNGSSEFGKKTFRLEVWLIDDSTGALLGRSGELELTLDKGEQAEARWTGLSWDIGYGRQAIRLAVVNSPASDGAIEVLGNTTNPYPNGYFYVNGVKQEGKAALFKVTSVRPGSTSGGADREGDAELRWRFLETKAMGGSAHFLALKSRLLAVPGVRALKLRQNREDVEVDGMPPHSFHAIVAGGSERDIAMAILRSAPAGIKSVGNLTVDVPDEFGEYHPIRFSRPKIVEIYASVTVVRGPGFSQRSITAIKDAIIRAIGGVTSDGTYYTGGIGVDVSHAKVIESVMRVEGVADVHSLYLGVSSPPTNPGNVPIGDEELAECALDRIEVSWV